LSHPTPKDFTGSLRGFMHNDEFMDKDIYEAVAELGNFLEHFAAKH
jgi:hypothetical protein